MAVHYLLLLRGDRSAALCLPPAPAARIAAHLAAALGLSSLPADAAARSGAGMIAVHFAARTAAPLVVVVRDGAGEMVAAAPALDAEDALRRCLELAAGGLAGEVAPAAVADDASLADLLRLLGAPRPRPAAAGPARTADFARERFCPRCDDAPMPADPLRDEHSRIDGAPLCGGCATVEVLRLARLRAVAAMGAAVIAGS
jgi:hypothetical protein